MMKNCNVSSHVNCSGTVSFGILNEMHAEEHYFLFLNFRMTNKSEEVTRNQII